MKRLVCFLLFLVFIAPIFADSARYGKTIITTDTGHPVAVTTEDNDRVVAITNAEYFIKEGNMWSLEVAIPAIAGNTTYYLTLDTRNMTKMVNAFPIQWEVTSSYVLVSQGTATDFTGGTDLSSNIKNRKAGADNREVEVFWNPSITGGSFSTLPNICAGGESTRQTASGGTFHGNLPMILGHGVLHCFKIENPTADDIAYMNMHIDWIEKDS